MRNEIILYSEKPQPSGTFNAKTNLLESSIPENLLGYIAVLYVLEESTHSCTVDHCQIHTVSLHHQL